MKSLRNGFSLIEVLIVLCIISLLTAVVLPIFARKRESARAEVCMSNLRQIGIGMSLYAADNNQLLPPYDSQAGAEFIHGKQKVSPAQGVELLASLYGYVGTDTIWYCPDDNPAAAVPTNGVVERHDTSYSYAGRYRKAVPGMLTEDFTSDNLGTADIGLASELCSPNQPNATWGNYSHSGRSNVLFEDGHVRAWPIHSSTYDYPNPW